MVLLAPLGITVSGKTGTNSTVRDMVESVSTKGR